MNMDRYAHGLQKMAGKIFAFGGKPHVYGYDMSSAEVYDIVQNSWKNLPDMPESGDFITCVRLQN